MYHILYVLYTVISVIILSTIADHLVHVYIWPLPFF